MTTIVLNEQTGQTTLRDLLESAVDTEIQINDEAGQFVARILLGDGCNGTSDESLAEAEANIDEIRRRMQSSREHDVTTKELMARCRALAPE